MLGVLQRLAVGAAGEIRPGLLQLLASGAEVALGGDPGFPLELLQDQLGFGDELLRLALARPPLPNPIGAVRDPQNDQDQQEEGPPPEGVHRDAVPILSRAAGLQGGHWNSLSYRETNINTVVGLLAGCYSTTSLRGRKEFV